MSCCGICKRESPVSFYFINVFRENFTRDKISQMREVNNFRKQRKLPCKKEKDLTRLLTVPNRLKLTEPSRYP